MPISYSKSCEIGQSDAYLATGQVREALQPDDILSRPDAHQDLDLVPRLALDEGRDSVGDPHALILTPLQAPAISAAFRASTVTRSSKLANRGSLVWPFTNRK